jgi:ABC-type nitrate/sulfonate/bicarbonate transport system permease component
VSRRSALVATALVLGIWELASLAVASYALPGPVVVAEALGVGLTRGLGWHAAVSSYRVITSMLLAAAVGAPLGLAIGQSPVWNRRLSPVIYLTYPVPKVVFLPLVLLFLGVGDESKIFLIWMILFFQVLVVVRDAAAAVRPDLVRSVRSLGASRWQLYRFVYFPACLPGILTGLRVSAGTAIAVLFIAESFATTTGLGYYIMVEGWGRMAYPDMYAGVVALSVIGLGLYAVLDWLERRLCPWAQIGG